jgi:integrase/recombinase XerC
MTGPTALCQLPGEPIDFDELEAAFRDALQLDLLAQARVIWWALRHDPQLERSTADRIGPVIARFAARQRTLGRTRLTDTDVDDVVGFVWARTRRGSDPAIATVHLRRTALRMLNRALLQLGIEVDDPSRHLLVPPKTRAELRPLDDDEIGLLRIAAAGRQRGQRLAMATVALAEATATTGEIAKLRWRDLDGPELCLPGTGRIRPRTATLTPWGQRALDRLAKHARPGSDEMIAYHGNEAPDSQAGQAAIVNRLARLLTLAPLDAPDIRPTSIRLWQPARQLAAGMRIEQLARQLGHTSLDVTATQLGFDWLAE